MLHERFTFNVFGHDVYLDAYLSGADEERRDAVLIFPGGGYCNVCYDREGEPIALAYLEHGINAFVLTYAVGEEYKYPSQLTDASFAICYIKSNADRFMINRDRIFAVGFSAGGHLAGSLAILHDDPDVLASLGIGRGDNKPCGAILSYPVVSAMCDTHQESFEYLSGKPFSEISEAEREKLSLEMNVSQDSAPAFIWHTSRDQLVPVLGSLRLTEAYYKVGTPVSLHVYPYGVHGLALSNAITAEGNPEFIEPLAEGWLSASVEWMKTVK